MNFSFRFVLVTKCVDFTQSFLKREEFYRRFVYSYVNLFKSQHSKAEKGGESDAPKKPKAVGPQQAALGPEAAGGISSSSSEDEDSVDSKRKSDGEVTFEGYSTHFGTTEAARWFLSHEMGNIRKCLEKCEVGFKLRLVGHSLGGATAALLAIMLRKKSAKELGFNPQIVSAVGYATPPCVSRELAESCFSYVTTVVMQAKSSISNEVRSEILQTDWKSVIEKEDWRSVIGLVTNAKQVVSSVQDVARKLSDYAKFGSSKNSSDNTVAIESGGAACKVPEELFVPGTVYYLKRNVDAHAGSSNGRRREYFTLWKRHPGEHFQRIVLSSNIITDHKCVSHYDALRDVLKDFPASDDENKFS
ncbi:hypothetical protein C1H46_041028 [Malus baccata]|uniref:Fungal lipase-type domain-containing protein n=1 Tax=Malus baccata TaxID=106549 RepID=A0A540KHG0_MALBA|nr:hypothetical protein C1H46_041028 [Malus baccata]